MELTLPKVTGESPAGFVLKALALPVYLSLALTHA